MGKKILVFLILTIFLISCGNAKIENKIPTATVVATKVSLTPESQASGPEQALPEKVKYVKKIVSQVKEIKDNLNNPSLDPKYLEAIYDYLSDCSVLEAHEEGAKYIYSASNTCGIVVITPSDSKLPIWTEFWNSNMYAAHNWDSQLIYLRYEDLNEISVQYLAAVLIHETVHARIQENRCRANDFDCIGEVEGNAYVLEFAVLDYLGMAKNPKYLDLSKKEAAKIAASYRLDNQIPLPDYEKDSLRMREFYDSHSDKQDRLWRSIHWLKINYMVFVLTDQSAENGFIQFKRFLAQLYRDGNI